MSNMMKVATRDIAEELAGYQDLAWLVLPDSEKQVYIRQAQHILNWTKTIDGEKYCIALVKKGELPDYPKDDPEEDAIDTGYTMGWKRLRAITKERNFMQVVYVAGEEER